MHALLSTRRCYSLQPAKKCSTHTYNWCCMLRSAGHKEAVNSTPSQYSTVQYSTGVLLTSPTSSTLTAPPCPALPCPRACPALHRPVCHCCSNTVPVAPAGAQYPQSPSSSCLPNAAPCRWGRVGERGREGQGGWVGEGERVGRVGEAETVGYCSC